MAQRLIVSAALAANLRSVPGTYMGLTPTDNSSSKGSNALYRHTHEMHINLRKPTHIHAHSQVTTNKKHGKLRIM